MLASQTQRFQGIEVNVRWQFVTLWLDPNSRPFVTLDRWLSFGQRISIHLDERKLFTGLTCVGAEKGVAKVSALASIQFAVDGLFSGGLFSGTDRLVRGATSSGASWQFSTCLFLKSLISSQYWYYILALSVGQNRYTF